VTFPIKLRTPAKINPVLEILGKRPDGFHELALIFQAVGLYDELEFSEKGSDIQLEILESPAPLAVDDSNLIVQAARLFLSKILKQEKGVTIRLKKNIPLAAGMGGGSSDAAATLWGLDRLFGTGVGGEGLGPLAAQLGSDVPFFLHGGTALGTGRGEIITPLSAAPELALVLVNPGKGLSTPAVYRSGKAVFSSGELARNYEALSREGDVRKIAGALFNGLEQAAFSLMGEVESYKKGLLQAGALGALVSGSGPTIFAMAENQRDAKRIGERMAGTGYAVYVVPSVAWGIQEESA